MTVRVNKSSFNIREKLSELGRKFGLKGSELAAAETVQEARDLVSAGRKNMFINGDFRVAQRNTSMSGRTSGGYWTVDRFQTGISAAGTWTISQSTDAPDGFTSSIKYDCTTANTSLGSTAQLYLVQKIEAQNLQHLGYGSSAAQATTFSFYFKTNKTGVYTVELFQADASRSIGFEMDVSQTGWQRYQFVIPGDTAGTINNDNGIGLWCFVWLAAGSSFTSGTFNNGAWDTGTQANRLSPRNVNFADSTSNELYITGYQFELGRNATEFEHRSYGEELALCQRYYGKIRLSNQEWIYNESNSTWGKWWNGYIPFSMRANPNVDSTDLTGGVSVSGLSGTVSTITPQTPGDTPGRVSMRVTMTVDSGTARAMYHTDGWASDYLAFDAEL